ncbi:MAG: hydrolase [Proteobacteria bacterium]|nr:hydrolase [Pseudomonadota bacterium]
MSTEPELNYPTYIGVALQPRAYGCRNKEEVRKHLKIQLNLIDDAFINSYLVGGGAVKLVALAEGSIQGWYDELNNMDHATYCKDIAIRIPGEETEELARKAREYDIYIAAQAKVVDPDIAEDRFLNQGFIISPKGEIILRHTKNVIGVVEGSASPYDLWEKWSAKYGDTLESLYPVAKTDIGNLGISICAETMFPESFRALAVNGAEVVIRPTWPEPLVSWGIWEASSITHAFANVCYMICPNNAPYYTTFEKETPYTLLGGQSMIVDYRGKILTQSNNDSVAAVAGNIDVRALREYRATSPQSAHNVQMRSTIWKKIYEKWPEYPKNLYMERDYPHVMERHLLHLSFLEPFFEKGIYARPKE